MSTNPTEIVRQNPHGIPWGPAAIHLCPVPGCLDIWESEPTCEHAALTTTPEPTQEPVLRCDTCRDTGRVPWMIEGDPYGEPDDGGTVPCPDGCEAPE